MLRRKYRSRGVAALEFGLILPLLMALLLGIIDYGYVFFVRLNMTNAAREGARVGVTRQDPPLASSDAIAAATTYLQTAGITADVTATQPDDGTPEVTVTVTIPNFVPIIGFVPTPDNMSVSSTMRWELAP